MSENPFGLMAKSLAGHDKMKIYVVLDQDAEYVYLVDGKIRTLERPKKKKKKHIQIINYSDQELILDKIKGTLSDASIRKAIKKYNNGNIHK